MTAADRRRRQLYTWLQWGDAPRREYRAHRPKGVPEHLAQLGRVESVELADGRTVTWPTPADLVVGPERRGRRSLYLVAPEPVTVDATGRIAAITYVAGKGSTPSSTRWRHAFEGTRPRLGRYATGEARIERAGSQYTVTDWGIVG